MAKLNFPKITIIRKCVPAINNVNLRILIMILVDTSVLIDFLSGKNSLYSKVLNQLINDKIHFGINSFIYQELLQGVKTEKQFEILKRYLSPQIFYGLKDDKISYEKAAEIYFKCRRHGLTVRSTIDCLIAQTAIENDLYLFHNNKDFDVISQITALKIYRY